MGCCKLPHGGAARLRCARASKISAPCDAFPDPDNATPAQDSTITSVGNNMFAPGTTQGPKGPR
eukprot:364683-Chlamydomonas_euryale.AAC.2